MIAKTLSYVVETAWKINKYGGTGFTVGISEAAGADIPDTREYAIIWIPAVLAITGNFMLNYFTPDLYKLAKRNEKLMKKLKLSLEITTSVEKSTDLSSQKSIENLLGNIQQNALKTGLRSGTTPLLCNIAGYFAGKAVGRCIY